MSLKSAEEWMKAAANPDWMQVVFNHGPPCFHVENGRFCLRAEKWDGHFKLHEHDILIHKFISLEDLLRATRANALRYAAEICEKRAKNFTDPSAASIAVGLIFFINAEAQKLEEGKQ
jgi:hypothetical protein